MALDIIRHLYAADATKSRWHRTLLELAYMQKADSLNTGYNW